MDREQGCTEGEPERVSVQLAARRVCYSPGLPLTFPPTFPSFPFPAFACSSGNTVVVSVITDADGDPSVTRTLSTVTTIPTTATTTTTADAAEDTINDNVGQPAVVGVPASLCTTAGCPVKPTTYTQNGVLMTWFVFFPSFLPSCS